MRITSALIASAIALAPMAAASANETEAPTATVSVEDLNLASSKGVAILDNRVQNAIRRMCNSGMRGLAASQAERECRATATANAERETNRVIAAARSADQRYADAIIDGRKG